MGNEKRVYVWEGVLCDWSCGMVCLYATSKLDAWKRLKKTQEVYLYEWIKREGVEPRVMNKSEVLMVFGGG